MSVARAWIRAGWEAWVGTLLVHTLRSSLLTGGVVMLVSSTGAWLYFASTLHAHDAQRAAVRAQSVPARVAVVAIDDHAFETFFGGRSPLGRGRLHHLLELVAQSAPSARKVVLDLDVSPSTVADPAQDTLDRLFLERPDVWVLPTTQPGTGERDKTVTQWQRHLCDAGVAFGHALVPTEFGYPRLTHQYAGSLAQVALGEPSQCGQPSAERRLMPLPLSPNVLRDGVVVPFTGDLLQLSELLRSLDPEWVWVGAAWGHTDVFGTPFGDRYGVQVHAAYMAGALEGQRMAPYFVQLLVAWWFLALMSALAALVVPVVQEKMAPLHPSMSGHAFFLHALLPVMFVLFVVASVMGLAELLAHLRALTGIWVPSAVVGSNVVAYMMLVWVWGRHAVRVYEGPRSAWSVQFLQPFQADLGSIARHLKHSADPEHPPLPTHRRLMELFLALTSLAVQTLVPLMVVVLAFMKSP